MKTKLRDKKVGVQYSLNKSDTLITGCVDGITFGLLNGKPFDNGKIDWPLCEKIRWANGNALFFQDLANKLNQWVKALETSKSTYEKSIKR